VRPVDKTWAEEQLQRREFLKNTAAIAGAAAVGGRAPSSMATTPKDTLLVLVENGPNSLDIHGVGTTFRSYVACWNLYDRLLTFGHKTLPDGGLSYDYTKIEPELAEEFIVSPEGMSVTFKLRRDATFHDGAPVDRRRCQMVARPRRNGRRLPDLSDGGWQPEEA
jgi:peptide/nickel transport system substrate-binding protein